MLKLAIIFGIIVGYMLIGYLVSKGSDAVHKYFYGHGFLEGAGWALAIGLWPLLLVFVVIFHTVYIPFKLFGYLNSKYGWCVVSLEVNSDNKEVPQDVLNFAKTVGLPVGVNLLNISYRAKTEMEQVYNYLETTGWRKCLANDNKTVRYYSKVVRKREVVKL